jgi:hypothetical protein
MGTYLEKDDDEHNNHGGKQLGNIWRVLTVEGLLKCVHLVLLGQHEVEERNDAAFKFSALISPDRNWRETLPKDAFADVCGDEK